MAQKVINVTCTKGIPNSERTSGKLISENSFPELDKLLAEGYEVAEVIPTDGQNYLYYLFILEKKDGKTNKAKTEK